MGKMVSQSRLEVLARSVFPGEGGEGIREELVSEVRADEERLFVERANRGEVIQGLKRTAVRLGEEDLLPPDLVENYRSLAGRALSLPGGVYVGDAIEKASGRAVTRISSGQTETRGPAKGSRKSGGSKDFIRDERAFAFKGKMDRKLRKLAREIRAWLNDSGETRYDVRRCSVCRQFGDPEWLYCPKDGKPMESV